MTNLVGICALMVAALGEGDLDIAASPVVRERQGVIVGGEMGWNGLAGFGLSYSRDISQDWSLDGGLGLGTSGYRLGVRGRYNFTQGHLRPFVGFGALLGTGHSNAIASHYNNSEVTYNVSWSPFVQAVGGLAWVADNGFACVATLGWAQLLRDNLVIIRGAPSHDHRELLEVVTGSGAVASLVLGYGF